MKRIVSLLFLMVLFSSPAFAAKYDLNIPPGLANDTFQDVVKQAGTVIAYRAIAPAEPQGITGFDLGVEVTAFNVDTDIWDEVIDSGDMPSYLGVPKLHVRKGLPFGIDLGASYAMVPDSNIKVIGGEIQYAIADGSMALPAIAVRGHYSTLLGVDDLDLKTYGADAVVSKGILIFTPYAGVGVLHSEGEYAGTDEDLKAELQDQSETTTRFFGGVQIALTLLRLTLDAEFSEVPVYTAKLSLGW